MPSRSWTLSIARVKTRAADPRKVPPAVRGVVDEILVACDALATELGDTELQLEQMRQEVLRQSAAYDHLFQQMPVACVVIDTSGRILKGNTEAGAILNVSPKKLGDRLLLHFVQDRETYLSMMAAVTPQTPARCAIVVRPRERAPLEVELHIVCAAPGDDDAVRYCFLTPRSKRAEARVVRREVQHERESPSGEMSPS